LSAAIDDIADTIEALTCMGIEIAHDRSQKQREEEMYCSGADPNQSSLGKLGSRFRTQEARRAGAIPRGGRGAAKDPGRTDLDPDAVRRPRASNSPRTKGRVVGTRTRASYVEPSRRAPPSFVIGSDL